MPVAAGGGNEKDNFVASCQICNGLKGARSPVIVGENELRKMIMDKLLKKSYNYARLRKDTTRIDESRPVMKLNDLRDSEEDVEHDKKPADINKTDRDGVADFQGSRDIARENSSGIHEDGGQGRSEEASQERGNDSFRVEHRQDGNTGSVKKPKEKMISVNVNLHPYVYSKIKKRSIETTIPVSILIRMAVNARYRNRKE